MAFFIKPPVTAALVFCTLSGRNCRIAAAAIYIINQLIAGIPPVSKYAAVFNVYMFKDGDCKVDVIALSFTDHHVDGIAVCIHGCVDFCTGTATAVPNFSRGDRLSGHRHCAGGPGQ